MTTLLSQAASPSRTHTDAGNLLRLELSRRMLLQRFSVAIFKRIRRICYSNRCQFQTLANLLLLKLMVWEGKWIDKSVPKRYVVSPVYCGV